MRTQALTLIAATAFASAAPLTSAAAATPAPVAAQAAPVYHQKDSGRTVKTLTGDTFQIRLEVCGDCGSSLKLTAPAPRVLRVEHRSITSTAKPPAVGGEQFETWTFKARTPGSASIRVSQRTASGKVSPRFHLTVHVTN
jgi:predicted secreted protein